MAHPNDDTRAEPASLSQSIDALRAAMAVTEALTGKQVADLVAFHRQVLEHLHTFASDYEKARALSPSPDALGHAASAAVRLYQRLNKPAAPLAGPLVVRMPPLPDNVVPLDLFRRSTSPIEGGAA